MTIFERVARWLRGRPIWAGNRLRPRGYDQTFSDNILLAAGLVTLKQSDIGCNWHISKRAT